MDNKEFDDVIKKKLESLNTDGSENAWDLFKEKWDNESNLDNSSEQISSEDQDLDAKIKTDMQKLRIPFNSKHWVILKEQLELEALFKKKLFLAKSVELVILALLVVGILNLWPIRNDIYQIPIYDIPMVASIPVDEETAKKHEVQEDARLSEQRILNQQLFNSTKKIVQKTITSVEVLSFYPSLLLSEKLDKDLINVALKSNDIKQSTYKNVINTSIFPFINTIQQESVNEKSKNQSTIKTNNNNNSIALLQSKKISELEIPIRSTGFPDIILDNNKSIKGKNTYLSFAIGPKMNLINSPFDPIYKIDPYNIINANFNILIKVHKEIGPIELFAGLGYTNTSYVPRLVDEIYEPLERQFNVASLENIEFKTFSIPLGVKYDVVETKKYQLYATAGIDLNVIAGSEYIIQDIPVGGSRSQPVGSPHVPPNNEPIKNVIEESQNITQNTSSGSSSSSPPLLLNSNSGSGNNVNPKAKLSQKEFNKGILSGGSLKDNLYATASVGLGLNWNVTPKFGIFIEPKYSHFISSNGIGPNVDKVHSLSVDLGFRYQLN